MNAKRLLKLADFLETVSRKRFYLAKWVGTTWAGKQDLSCGTTGCAMGWAATMSGFRRLGLRLNKEGIPEISGHEGFNAAEFLFDLDDYNAYKLFGGDSCPLPRTATPKQVASHIRQFVKQNGENHGEG